MREPVKQIIHSNSHFYEISILKQLNMYSDPLEQLKDQLMTSWFGDQSLTDHMTIIRLSDHTRNVVFNGETLSRPKPKKHSDYCKLNQQIYQLHRTMNYWPNNQQIINQFELLYQDLTERPLPPCPKQPDHWSYFPLSPFIKMSHRSLMSLPVCV